MSKKTINNVPLPQTPTPISSAEVPCRVEWIMHDLPSETVALFNMVPRYPEIYKDKDFALLPDGKLIRLKPQDYRDPDHKKYPDAIPIVWEEWLYGPRADAISTLAIGDAIVIAATGLKGNGKSETLAFLSAKALALDMPVWSNMDVKFWLVRSDGIVKLCQSLPLDWGAVLTLSKDLEKGAMVIDELSYYASSRLSSSVRNRILNATVNQVRKRTLDFYCSVKFLRQIDVNIREELDAHFDCEDVARSYAGQKEGLDKGCFITWNIKDISGWSGSRNKAAESLGFDTLGEPIYRDSGEKRLASLRFTWPLYNSYEVVDTADAFRKVRLDLQETIITDKPSDDVIESTLGAIIDNYKDSGFGEVTCDEFRQSTIMAGINLHEKQLGKVLKDSFGITRKRRHKANVYILEDEN